MKAKTGSQPIPALKQTKDVARRLFSHRISSYALLHLSDVELYVALQLQVFLMRTVHLVLDILFQISHLQELVAYHFTSRTCLPSSQFARF